MEHEAFQKNKKKPKNFDFYGTIILFLEHTQNNIGLWPIGLLNLI